MRGIARHGWLLAVLWLVSTALPAQAGKIYWPSCTGDLGCSSKVERAELDGSNVELLLFSEGEFLSGIALDLGADKMYLTAKPVFEPEASIVRTDLNGCARETIFSTSGEIRQLAIDVNAGKIYWSQQTALPKIRRANLDGSGAETIATSPGGMVGALALDLVNDKIYWSDDGDTVRRANLDGSSPETVLTGLGQVFGLAADGAGGKIYWTEVGLVRRADLDGSNPEDVVTVTENNGLPLAIALDLVDAKIYYSVGAFENLPTKIFRAGLDGSGEEMILAFSHFTKIRQVALDPLDEGEDPRECAPPVPASSAYGVVGLAFLLLVTTSLWTVRRALR
jgi:hypothetical protein